MPAGYPSAKSAGQSCQSESQRDNATSIAVGDKIVLVLVGMTGGGKSTTGSTITGVPNTFKASNGWKSETRGCAFKDFDIDGVNYRIIDTPGLKDTNLDAEALHEQFRGFCDYAPDGVDVFLYVLKKDRFTPETAAAFKAFREACGDAALQHTLMLVTHAEELEGGVSQNVFREDVVTHARDVPEMFECLESIGGSRVVGVHNKASKRVQKDIRKEIMDMMHEVRSSNNSKRYSNEQLEEAQKWRDSIKEEARKLEDPDHCQELLNELSECFHGRRKREHVEQKKAQLKVAEANLRDIKAKAEADQKRAEDERRRADENSKLREAAEKQKEEADGNAAQWKNKAKAAQTRADNAIAAAQRAGGGGGQIALTIRDVADLRRDRNWKLPFNPSDTLNSWFRNEALPLLAHGQPDDIDFEMSIVTDSGGGCKRCYKFANSFRNPATKRQTLAQANFKNGGHVIIHHHNLNL